MDRVRFLLSEIRQWRDKDLVTSEICDELTRRYSEQHLALSNRLKAETILQEAQRAAGYGQYEQAAELCREAMPDAPLAAWRQMGLIAVARGHLPDAVHAFQKALEIAPRDEELQRLLARVKSQAERSDRLERRSWRRSWTFAQVETIYRPQKHTEGRISNGKDKRRVTHGQQCLLTVELSNKCQ